MRKMIQEIGTIIAAIISGGAITALLTYWTAQRSAKKDDFRTVMDVYKEDNDRLRKDIEQMSLDHVVEKKAMMLEINTLRQEVSELRGKVSVLEKINKHG